MSYFSNNNTNTSTQNQKPWNYKDLRDVNNFAQYLMSKNYGFRPYNRPNYAPFSTQSLDAFGQMEDIANSGTSLIPGASNFLQGMLGGNGMTSEMMSAMNPLQGISDGTNSIGVGNWQDALGASKTPTASGQNLQDIASGKILKDGNPYLMDALSKGAEQIALRSNTGAAGSGRYGSAAAAGGTAGAVGDYYAKPLAAAYESGLNRMLGANQQIDAAEMARLKAQMEGAQGVAGVEAANIANQSNAASQMLGFLNQGANRGMQAAQLSPILDQARYADADRLRAVGQQYEAKTQQAIDQDKSNWEANQNRLWQMLSQYASIVNGTTQGAMQQTNTPQQNSWAQNILGGAMAGGGAFGPWGALLGGALGGFM